MTPPLRRIAAAALLSLPLTAQDAYWIANLDSNEVRQIAPTGEVLQTVDLGHRLTGAHLAPDGKVWVIRYSTNRFDILRADGSLHGSPTFAFVSAARVAFDAQGHAWVSGDRGVQEFDADGQPLRAITLAHDHAFGVTIDADGNKWVAHHTAPPSYLSRIDGITGAVTDHILSPNSQLRPSELVADQRGPGTPGHVWVIGDGAGGEVMEFDSTGRWLRTLQLDPLGSFGSLTCDIDPASGRTRRVLVGDFRSGNVWRIDVQTGAATATRVGSSAVGLAFGDFGNLWVTNSLTDRLHRHDAASLVLETETALGAGSFSPLGTLWHHATVVAAGADHDGDGVPSLAEIQGGSSPFDPQSTPRVSLSVEGPTELGSTTALRIRSSGATTGVFLGTARASSPFGLPGVAGLCGIDPGSTLPITLVATGDATFHFGIPRDVRLQGVTLLAQAVHQQSRFDSAFSNVTGWRFF